MGWEGLDTDLTKPRKQTLHLNPLIPWNRGDKSHFLIPCLGQTSLIHSSALISQTYSFMCVSLLPGYRPMERASRVLFSFISHKSHPD